MNLVRELQLSLCRTKLGTLAVFVCSIIAHPKRTLDDIFIGMLY